MDQHTAHSYIHTNFRPEDRIAIVLIRKSSGTVVQRISTAGQVRSNGFQRWLHHMNKEQHEIYISMNTLHEQAHSRTKNDVAEIRHIYLDFDHNAQEGIRKLCNREGIPTPNHLIESSPGRYQVIWRVTGFEKTGAEILMRGMVHEFGADVAATDCARVLRLPGFYNYKYEQPQLVRVENLSRDLYQPSHFPEYSEEAVRSLASLRRSRIGDRRKGTTGLSQSERDWAYAKRALARGDKPAAVMRAIASYRQDKANPDYYAKHTVEKACADEA